MGIHVVGRDVPAQVRVSLTGPFEGIREVVGSVPLGVPLGERLRDTHLSCQRGGPALTGEMCRRCSRFGGWRSGPGPGHVTIQCLWTESDPVRARMTFARAIVFTRPELGAAEADALARRIEARHFLVQEHNRLSGVACRCDLVGAADGECLGDLMSREIFVIDADASLGEAVAGMAALQIGCLPVVQNGDLVGIITRGDVRRTGIEESLLGAHYCASCGSPHGVRPDPRGAVEYCLDCIEREMPEPDDDIGTGD